MEVASVSPLVATHYYMGLKEAAPGIEAAYRARTPSSARLAQDACMVLPGGSTRQGVSRRPYPLYLSGGSGSHIRDVDGRELVDFWFNATALPLGHADPRVVAAVTEQLPKGTAYFAPTELELKLARRICQRLPSAERVFFLNTGGEAVMMALRIARSCTGRPLVGKCEGSFHGNHDDVLWSIAPTADDCGPADAPVPVAASGGLLPPHGRTVILPFNDLDAVQRIVEREASRLAAIIVEPAANRMGLVPPRPGFLEGVRELCTRYGILLIFDEVLCFRASYHGMQGLLGVTPDLTTLGKIIGGGFPVGAVAGRAESLAVLEADRPAHVYHTGTFAANPVTLTAGLTTLDALTPEAFDVLNGKGARVRQGLLRICRGLPLQITGIGSLFKISATTRELLNYRSTLTADMQWQEIASLALLNEGFFLTPQLHGCVATSTTDEQIDAFLLAFERLVRGHGAH
ncbi:MAG: aspartate aminotransferase family protein [Vicinamibacterales bacterium]